MSALKLSKLPDRTPVKITITVNPDLNKALAQYAEDYNHAYGNAKPEPLTELLPYMLQSFLDSDRTFVRAQKKRQHRGTSPDLADRVPRRIRGNSSSTTGA